MSSTRVEVPYLHVEDELRIPSIIVTPVLPSRSSLPTDMQSALDSILRPVSSQNPQRDAPAVGAVVVKDRHDLTEGDAEDDKDTETPHAPSNTQPVTAENHFLLNLEFENTSFSFCDVLTALDMTCREEGRETAIKEAPADPAKPSESRSRLSLGYDDTEYVVVTEDMLRLSPPPMSASGPGLHVAVDSQPQSMCRRAGPPSGPCPPTWRHAVYVSSLVWPAQQWNGATRGDEQRKSENRLLAKAKPRRWCGMDFITRTLGLKH